MPVLAADGNQDMPAPADGNQDMPAPADGNQDMPAPADGIQDIPPPADGNQNMPPPAAGNPDMPPPANGNPDMPPPADDNRDIPPPAEGNQDIPPPADGNQDAPAVGNQDIPAPEKKKNLRHIKDGKVNVTTARTGKDRTDSYFKRSHGIVKAAKALHNITETEVHVDCVPTWPSGVRRQWSSPNYSDVCRAKTILNQSVGVQVNIQDQEQQRDEDDAQAGPSTSATPSPRKRVSQPCTDASSTPKAAKSAKSKVSKSTRYDKNVCAICGIRYCSDADKQLPDQTWISCNYNACSYWVHSRCSGVYYPTTKSGDNALKKWVDAGHFYCPKHMPKK